MAAHGHFLWDARQTKYKFTEKGKQATALLFKLISMLQFGGTGPMIDVNACGDWLTR